MCLFYLSCQGARGHLVPRQFCAKIGYQVSSVVMANGTFNIGSYSMYRDDMEGTVAHEVGHAFELELGDEYDNAEGRFQCAINSPPREYRGCPWTGTTQCDGSFQCLDSRSEDWKLTRLVGTSSVIRADRDRPYEVGGRGALPDKMSFMAIPQKSLLSP